MHDLDVGLIVNGRTLNNISDVTIILAGMKEHLQFLMVRLAQAWDTYGLKLNSSGTKYVLVGKNKRSKIVPFINGIQLEQVSKV